MHRPPCVTWLSWSRTIQTSVSCVPQSITLSTLLPAKMERAWATGSKSMSLFFSHSTLRPKRSASSFSSMSLVHTKTLHWLMGAQGLEHSPFVLHICSFTWTTPAKWTSRGYSLMSTEMKGHMYFRSRFLSMQRQELNLREDGGGSCQKANVVPKMCKSFCLPLYSPPVTALCIISLSGSNNFNWITGLFSLQSSTQGTAAEFAQISYGTYITHHSTLCSKISSMTGLFLLCLGLHVSRLITALWVSLSLKKMGPIPIKSLKTWLLKDAHVAKTESNMPFFGSFYTGWIEIPQRTWTVITVL